jgi:hypothetical protein
VVDANFAGSGLATMLGLALARGRPELRADVEQAAPRIEEVVLGLPDGGAHHLGEREPLEHGDDVGEGLVQCRHLGAGGLVVAAMQPAQRRMGDLVGDDVVRQAGEYQLSRQVRAGIVDVGRKVTEEDGVQVIVEVGVAPLERVRHQAQALATPEAKPPSQCTVEVLQDPRRDRIDHLLVELRIRFGGFETLLHRNRGIVEWHRAVIQVGRGVVVDDLEAVVPEGALGALDLAIGDLDGHPVVPGPGDHWIEGEYS